MTLAVSNTASQSGRTKGVPQRGYQPHLQQDASMYTNRSTAVHSGDGAIEHQPASHTREH
eukprot:gene19563-14186_t